jgi:RNA polymerase sigma-70 factor (ECF subfamily)
LKNREVAATQTDQQLLAKAQNGDTAAFEALIVRYEKLIYTIAYRFFNNREDAWDISQEALLKIYRSLDKCRNGAGFKSWAATIVTNACIDESRRRKARQAESLDGFYEDEDGARELELPSDETTPDEALVRKESGEEIKAALRALTEEHRALIILRDIYGFSYAEIAEQRGLRLGTVKSGISRARDSLKKLLSPNSEQKKQKSVIHNNDS